MFRSRGALCAVILSLAAAMGAVQARAETLTEALVSAYRTNPQLAAVRASLRVTDEDLAEALSAFKPVIEWQGGAGNAGYRSSVENPITGRRNAPWRQLRPRDSQVQAILPLFPLSGFAALASADARVQVGQANLAAVEQQVFVDVVGAYLDVIRDEALVEITKEIEASLRRELDSNRRRFDEGDVSQTDIALTQTRLSQVQADHVTAQQNLRRSRSAYEEVVGHPPADLVSPSLPPGLPPTKEAATSLAIEGNPSLEQARLTEELARVDIGRAEAGFAPTLNVVGSSSYAEEQSVVEEETEQYSLQLQLRVPLYEGGATQSRVRRAKELWSQRRAETIATERQTVRQVADAFDALTTTDDVIKYSQEGVDAARAALDGVRKEATLGFRTTFDVLDSEQNLLDAQRRLKIAERNRFFAGWQLLAAIGAFNARDVGLETPIYDPKAHADAVEDAWFAVQPLDVEPVPEPTSTVPAALMPAEAARALTNGTASEAAPSPVTTPAPAPDQAPAQEGDLWDELFGDSAEPAAAAAPPPPAPAAPSPYQAAPPAARAPAPTADQGDSFWTDVLGIPADEIQPP